MNDNKITKAILHDFLVECYIAYKSDIKDKDENKLESIPKPGKQDEDEYKKKIEWFKQLESKFGSQLVKVVPIMMEPNNVHHLPWIISSLEPNNIAKMTILCPSYHDRIDDLIRLMSTDPVPTFMIENLLAELKEDALSVQMYARN